MTILSTNPEHNSPGQQFLFPDELDGIKDLIRSIKLAISDYSAELEFYYSSESRWTDLGRHRIGRLNDHIQDLNVCEDKVYEIMNHFIEHGEVVGPEANIVRTLTQHRIKIKDII